MSNATRKPPIEPKDLIKLVERGLMTAEQAQRLMAEWATPPMVIVPSGVVPYIPEPSSGVVELNKIADEMYNSFTDDHISINRPERHPIKEWSLYDKLKMRLNLQKGDTFGFDFLHIFNSGQKIFVFVAHDNQASHIEEDNPTMFPSDAFMARYYLVREALVTASGKPPFPGNNQPNSNP